MSRKETPKTGGTITIKNLNSLALNEISEEDLKANSLYVWAWGKNNNGELSFGINENAILPRAVKGIGSNKVIYISSGTHHSSVVTEDGRVLTCGSYLHKMLGIEGINK